MATAGTTEAAAPPAPAKKSPMMIIMIVAIIVSMAASLLVAKVIFGKSASAAAKPEAPKVGSTMDLDEFLINLADMDADRYVKTTISLGLKEGLTPDDLKDYVPEIRDAIVMQLQSEKLADIRDTAGKEALKKTLVARINDAVKADGKGDDQVVAVYFQAFATQ